MSRRSPQEKKRLSYARDRRNDYAENDKSSRTAVRLNKRFPNRSNRHQARQDLRAATGTRDSETAEIAENTLRSRRPRKWRKVPDRALGDHVETILTRRIRTDPADAASETRLTTVRTRRRAHTRRSAPTEWTYLGRTAQHW
ncbi:hypothetical protein LO762_24420 [Actinocorallia sp. API 0066]|uniref:hypothetical protein n=1 Tax=Actinocorallia sp. API 0066 TaxID=2896846 RepID=UPI001E44C226|nr:hypothetical protein [Actinocorallia sp. API 0066]MCD0452313.1 hypothetical protein [Actinocorallia sp. API 0066]